MLVLFFNSITKKLNEMNLHQTGGIGIAQEITTISTDVKPEKKSSQLVQIISGDRNYKNQLKLGMDSPIPKSLHFNLDEFSLSSRNSVRSIVATRIRGHVKLDDKEVQDAYPTIHFEKILSLFYYEQEDKMWENSIFHKMETSQSFVCFFTKDLNGTVCIFRFFMRSLHKLSLSIHLPEDLPFLFENGFIGSKIQLESLRISRSNFGRIHHFIL